jgi:parallel beta-helix repeat protein
MMMQDAVAFRAGFVFSKIKISHIFIFKKSLNQTIMKAKILLQFKKRLLSSLLNLLLISFMSLIMSVNAMAQSEIVTTIPAWDGTQTVHVCTGGTVIVQIENSDDGHTYRITKSAPSPSLTIQNLIGTGGTIQSDPIDIFSTIGNFTISVIDITDLDPILAFTVNVSADPTAPTLTPSPAPGIICPGTSVSATILSAGSGGVSGCADGYEYRINGGAWQSYTPGNLIADNNTNTSVDIRALREHPNGLGCFAETTYSWTFDKKVQNQTLNKYYCTIQEAIDDAVAGNTIVVSNGTYIGNLEINKQLILKAENQHAAIIQTQSGFNAGSGYGGITFVANGSTLEGFKIEQNVAQAIIHTHNSNNVTIKNNWIIGLANAPRGIDVGYGAANSEGVIIQGNIFNNVYCAVYVNQASDLSIDDNNFQTMGDGAVVFDGTWSYDEINITNNTTTTATNYLMYFYGSQGEVTYSGNTLTSPTNLTNWKVVNITKSIFYETIQAAVTGADPTNVIEILEGTYALTAPVNITKALTLQGKGRDNTTVELSSAWFNITGQYAFTLNAVGITVKDIHFKVVGKGAGDILAIFYSNAEIRNNKFSGAYEFGDGQVTRATVWSANPVTGIVMDNNIIESLRQPGYLSNGSGVISNNTFNITRGWVIEGAGTLQFTGNTWATNSSHVTILVGANISGLTINNNDFSGTKTDWAIDNRTTTVLDASCNWFGTDDYPTILPKNSGPMVVVPYLLSSTLSGTCGGGPAKPISLGVTHTEASENIVVQFTVDDNDLVLNPIPGLDPTTPAGKAAIATLYQSLATALAGDDLAAIQAAAMAIGDDVITEYYYYTVEGNLATKTYLKTAANNDLVKSKYWQDYLVRVPDLVRFPNWSANRTVIDEDASYLTNTNPETFAVVSGWLNNVLGRNLYVTVTFINNGYVNTITESVAIPAGPVNVYSAEPIGTATWVSSHNTIQAAIDAASNGYFVVADAGTYEEKLSISKPLTLLGPNHDKTGYASDRVAEAIIQYPAGTYSNNYLANISTNGVSIKGFTFNDNISGSMTYNGTLPPPTLVGGVISHESNTLVENNRFLGFNNIAVRMTQPDSFNQTVAKVNNSTRYNYFEGSTVYHAIYYQTSGGIIEHNHLVNVSAGLQIQPYFTNAAGTVSHNEISTFSSGLYYNYANWTIDDDALWSFTSNAITAPSIAPVWNKLTWDALARNFDGIRIETYKQDNASAPRIYGPKATFTSNTIDGNNASTAGGWLAVNGIYFRNVKGEISTNIAKIQFSSNTLTNVQVGAQFNETTDVKYDLVELYANGNTYPEGMIVMPPYKIGYARVVNITKSMGYETIQAAVNDANPAGGDVIEVSAGTYNEQVLVNKGVTIKGVGVTRPVVNFTGTDNNNSAIFYVSSPNVTIENLEIQLNQSVVMNGIKTSNSGTFNNLTVKDCNIYGTATTGNSVWNSFGIFTGSFGGVHNDQVTITGNNIGKIGTSALSRAIRLYNYHGEISGNTLEGYYSIQAGDNGGGNFLIDDNQLYGNAEINNLAQAGIFSNNDLYPSNAYGAGTDAVLMELKNISNPGGSLLIQNNTFNDYLLYGMFAGRVNNVTVDNNTFTPDPTATDFVSVYLNTKQRTSAAQSVFINGIKLTKNNFVGNSASSQNGIAFEIANYDNVSSFGSIIIGETGKENIFQSNNNQFIVLNNESGSAPTIGFWNGLYASIMAPVDIDIDAENNHFATSTPTLPANMTLTQLFALEDKVFHAMDATGLGLVTWVPSNVYVTTNTLGIQRGIDVVPNSTVNVGPGIFNEDVNINKNGLQLLGSGIDVTTVTGPIGGSHATMRVTNNSTGVLIDGFTITRDGNNVTDWNNTGLKSAGIAIQGQTNAAEIRNSRFYGNRTAIDINNSNGNIIRNNIISDNRTGLLFRNQTDNTVVENNYITDNWTVGILFLDASSGTNSPVQSAVNSSFGNNDISGNWYGDVEDRQSGGSIPTPGTNIKDFECNWFGAAAQPKVSVVQGGEPGYSALIPIAYGGTAVPPTVAQANIKGSASANIHYSPWLVFGADNSSDTGFQPVADACDGTPVVIASAIPDHITCGETTGSVLVTYSGGTAPYDITWTGGSFDDNEGFSYNISGLAAGTYTITVTDANGSSANIGPVEVKDLPITLKDNSLVVKDYYPTIQAAIDAAISGDQIEICAGTYIENATTQSFTLGTKQGLKFIGQTDLAGNPTTIIQGSLYLNDNDNGKVENIKFIYNTTLSLLSLQNTNGLEIKNCVFVGDNFTTLNIVGINHVSGPNGNSAILVEDCKFIDGLHVSINSRFGSSPAFSHIFGLHVKNSIFNNVKSGINQQSANDVIVENSTFNLSGNSSYGVRFASATDIANNLSITGSVFTVAPGYSSSYAIHLRAAAGGVLLAENNTIGFEVLNQSTALLNATCNWYETEDASVIAAKITGPVHYLPFLRVDNDYGDDYWWSTDKYSCIGVGPVVVYDQDPSIPGTNIIGSHMTIQAAIDASTTLNGHYIAVSSGNYDELVNVYKEVTISGHGADNTLLEKLSPAADANFITISASNVAIKDIAISGPEGGSTTRGIHINGTHSNVSIVNVISQQHLYGVHVNEGSDITNLSLANTSLTINGNGLQIDAGAKVDGLTITGGEISSNLFGLSVAAHNTSDNSDDLKNVTITGTEFKDNAVFGLMFNKGQDMTLSGLTVTGNGNGSTFGVGAGIYFTWRQGTYSGITVTNSTISGNRTSGTDNGGGIWVRPRAGASASGIAITNNLISGNGSTANAATAGIVVLKNNDNTGTDPGIVINGNSITGNANFGIASTTTDDIDATCNWFGVTSSAAIAGLISGNVNYDPWLIPDATTGLTYPWSGSDKYTCGGTPVVIESAVATNQTCDGQGTIVVTFSGGTTPYSIEWTGGTPVTVSSPYTILGLSAGSYDITVTDANGSSDIKTGVSVGFLPVKNLDLNAYYATINEAITAASNGHTIELCAGNYTETVNINKDLTIKGPNAGIDPNGVTARFPEAVILDGKFEIMGANTVVIDGIKIYQTNTTTPVSLGGSTVATIQNTIIERFGSTTGSTVRGIETSAGAGVKNIKNNLFTGDVSGGLFGGHKTWNSGMYINSAGSTMNIENNVFENCRTALNLDDYNANIALTGNTFDNNGTHISFGGTTPTTGSYTLGSNNFKAPGSAIINLSNVTTAFRLDITSSMYDGAVFSSLDLATLFNIEFTMFHRSKSGRNGLVYYVGNNLYVRSNDNNNIQTAVDYAATGNVINLMDGTYNQRVVLSKSLTLDGQSEAGTIIDGTGLGNGRGISINTGITNVGIQDLTVQNFSGASGNLDAGIYAIGGNNNLTVEHVTIKDNVGGSGFYANGPIDNVTLDYVTSSGHTVGARGIVIWNGLKSNITITNCTVFNNNCCGIELQDGDATGVLMENNNVFNNGDNGIGVVGLTGPGENLIKGNTITNNGRFGIEIKNPNGSGLATGDGRIVVENNNVSMTGSIADLRDMVGIAAFRRGVLAGNVDIPTGVVIQNNTVSGYTQPSTSDGFGIVVEGTNHTVSGNTLNNNDVGIQQQAGHTPYPTDGDQANVADLYFGRGNSPELCNVTVSSNNFSGNTVDQRIVTGGGTGTEQPAITPTVDEPADQVLCEGGTASVTFTGNNLTGVVYNWFNNDPSIGLAASGSGNISFTVENTSGVTKIATLTVTPVANGCTGESQTFTITVKPVPTITSVGPSEVNVCAGTSVSFTANGLINGVNSFNYTVTGPGGPFTGTESAMVTGGTYTFPAAVYPEGTYEITINSITIDGCINTLISGNTASFTVITPVAITSVTAAANPICATETTTLTANGVVGANATVTWYSGPNATGTMLGTGLTLPGATSPNTYYAYVTGDCGTAEASLVIEENGPVKNETTGRFYCTIQSAITAASNNDVIKVSAGTYNENLNFSGKSLTLNGPFATTSGCDPSRGIGEAIIAGNITVSGSSLVNAVIAGFRIESGNSPAITGVRLSGGGIYNNVLAGSWTAGDAPNIAGIATGTSAPVSPQSWSIQGNKITGYRFGLNLDGAGGVTGTIADNCISQNQRGIQTQSALHDVASNIQILTNDISNNEQGIRVARGNTTIRGNTISNNTVFGISPGVASATLDNLTITENFISGSPAALLFVNNFTSALNLNISSNSFTSNTFAINSTVPTSIPTTCNWFGTISAASVAALVQGNVSYSPWLTIGTDYSTDPGFQPVPESCGGTPVVIASAVPTHILCGGTTGSILLNFSGGSPNYSIHWGATPVDVTSNDPYTISGLSAGNYTISVKDVYGSEAIIMAEVLYLPVSNTTNTPNTYYPTIQAAIDEATSGDVIEVCAGIYAEDIVIDKAIDLRGPNYNISPNTESRVAEAIIVPADVWNADPDNNSGGKREWNWWAIVSFNADGIKMNGFKISGDNPLLDGYDYAGMDVEAGIGVYSEGNNIEFQYNYVENFTVMGFWAGGSQATQYKHLNVHENKIDKIHDVGLTGFGFGMYIQGTAGSITNNVVTNVRSGIQVQPYQVLQGSSPSIVENNSFSAYVSGLYYNYAEVNASAWTIQTNTIGVSIPPVTPPDGPLGWTGMKVETMRNTSNGGILTGNTINGSGATADNNNWTKVWGMQYTGGSSNSTEVYFTNNIVSNVDIGFEHSANADIVFTGNNLSANIKAISVNSAYNIDATGGNTINGLASGAATLTQLYTIEDAIAHKVDEFSRGLVTVKANELFVTPNSFAGAETAASIQRAIDGAGASDWTVNVQGSAITYAGDVNTSGKAITLSVGASPACATIDGDLTLVNSTTLLIDLDGTVACTGYDQLIVTGTVTLGGATLNLNVGYTPVTGDEFTIIDGSSPIVGQFAANTVTIGGQLFVIDYAGGVGNDVVLKACDGGVVNTNTNMVFCSIQEAIDNPLTLDGHTITVAAGTYPENLLVNKELIITGAGAATTTLLAGAGIAVEVTADNVTIQGFEIKHSTIASLADMGIRLNKSNSSTIQNNKFTMNSLGIQVLDAGNNTIYQNEFAYNAIGIYFEGTTDGLGNFDVGSNGPFYSLSLNNTVEENNIHHSILIGGQGGQGIYLDAACEGNEFISNTISNNAAIGYFAWKASNNILSGNTIANNGSEGIQLQGSSGNQITGNTVSGSPVGIWMRSPAENVANNAITENTITGNDVGIKMEDDYSSNNYAGVLTGNTISSNKIYGNTSFGLQVVDVAPGTEINAANNWWGSVSGPTYTGNPCGTGDAISDNVLYDCWFNNIDLELPVCQLQAYTVSGSSSVCIDNLSADITLSNSQSGVVYHLYANGELVVGEQQNGTTGSELTWTVTPTENTVYTVKATHSLYTCELPMNGSATIFYGPVTTAPTIFACPGTTINVPITVKSFNRVRDISLTLQYDPTIMTYTGFTSGGIVFAPLGEIMSNPASGGKQRIRISKISDNQDFNAIDDDEVLVTLHFSYISGYTSLEWIDDDGVSCEYSYLNTDGDPLNWQTEPFCDTPTGKYYFNGSVSEDTYLSTYIGGLNLTKTENFAGLCLASGLEIDDISGTGGMVAIFNEMSALPANIIVVNVAGYILTGSQTADMDGIKAALIGLMTADGRVTIGDLDNVTIHVPVTFANIGFVGCFQTATFNVTFDTAIPDAQQAMLDYIATVPTSTIETFAYAPACIASGDLIEDISGTGTMAALMTGLPTTTNVVSIAGYGLTGNAGADMAGIKAALTLLMQVHGTKVGDLSGKSIVFDVVYANTLNPACQETETYTINFNTAIPAAQQAMLDYIATVPTSTIETFAYAPACIASGDLIEDISGTGTMAALMTGLPTTTNVVSIAGYGLTGNAGADMAGIKAALTLLMQVHGTKVGDLSGKSIVFDVVYANTLNPACQETETYTINFNTAIPAAQQAMLDYIATVPTSTIETFAYAPACIASGDLIEDISGTGTMAALMTGLPTTTNVVSIAGYGLTGNAGADMAGIKAALTLLMQVHGTKVGDLSGKSIVFDVVYANTLNPACQETETYTINFNTAIPAAQQAMLDYIATVPTSTIETFAYAPACIASGDLIEDISGTGTMAALMTGLPTTTNVVSIAGYGLTGNAGADMAGIKAALTLLMQVHGTKVGDLSGKSIVFDVVYANTLNPACQETETYTINFNTAIPAAQQAMLDYIATVPTSTIETFAYAPACIASGDLIEDISGTGTMAALMTGLPTTTNVVSIAGYGLTGNAGADMAGIKAALTLLMQVHGTKVGDLSGKSIVFDVVYANTLNPACQETETYTINFNTAIPAAQQAMLDYIATVPTSTIETFAYAPACIASGDLIEDISGTGTMAALMTGLPTTTNVVSIAGYGLTGNAGADMAGIKAALTLLMQVHGTKVGDLSGKSIVFDVVYANTLNPACQETETYTINFNTAIPAAQQAMLDYIATVPTSTIETFAYAPACIASGDLIEDISGTGTMAALMTGLPTTTNVVSIAGYGLTGNAGADMAGIKAALTLLMQVHGTKVGDLSGKSIVFDVVYANTLNPACQETETYTINFNTAIPAAQQAMLDYIATVPTSTIETFAYAPACIASGDLIEDISGTGTMAALMTGLPTTTNVVSIAGYGLTGNAGADMAGIKAALTLLMQVHGTKVGDLSGKSIVFDVVYANTLNPACQETETYTINFNTAIPAAQQAMLDYIATVPTSTIETFAYAPACIASGDLIEDISGTGTMAALMTGLPTTTNVVSIAGYGLTGNAGADMAGIKAALTLLMQVHGTKVGDLSGKSIVFDVVYANLLNPACQVLRLTPSPSTRRYSGCTAGDADYIATVPTSTTRPSLMHLLVLLLVI